MAEKVIRTIGVLTSGGDAPGMNAAIRAVVRTALGKGLKVRGIRRGYSGLLNEEIIDLSARDVSDTIQRGGTTLLTARCEEMRTPEGQQKAAAICKKYGIDGLVVIGGDGSFKGAQKLSDFGVNTIGLPGTIDLDIACTEYTIGFDTAVNTAMEAIDKVRDTSTSHERCSIIEVMGRNAGWLTGASALAEGEDCEGPDMIYMPELSFDVVNFRDRVASLLEKKTSVVVAVSEGICTADGKYVCELGNSVDFVDAFGHKQLSGTAAYLANYIAGELECKTRAIELSTLQRAASHCSSRVDILEAYQVGGAAVKAADEGDSGKMVVLQRLSDDPYQCGTEVKDVHKIANDEKLVPREWVNEDGTYVTGEFVSYVRPLIQGDVSQVMVDGIPRHLNTPRELSER